MTSGDEQLKDINDLEVLPPLRPTLEIVDGGFDYWHDRVWILVDRISNRFFYLGRYEYEIISRWNISNIDELILTINKETILNIERVNLDHVLKFLLMNNLLIVGKNISDKIKQSRNSPLNLMLKSAAKLFYFRVPLFNPDKFLEKTQKYIKPLFTSWFLYIIFFVFILDVYLVSSYWGSFAGSVPSLTNFTSVILILGTLIGTKILHEFGHAYSCKLAGVKVPEMGVTFIFFYPLFYTDVTNSIILNPSKRLIISTAGIRFELYLAIIAGLFWFLITEPGVLKNMLFFVSAISWTVSIAFNMIPFVKFDGYYILSDYLKIRNLGVRANTILKYYSRNYLFGIDSIIPESYNKKKFRFFLIFNMMTGVYRVFVFSSILLFLYYIQIVGIVLLMFGISLLLIVPFTRELYNIWQLRKKMRTFKNIIITSLIFSAVTIAIFVPIRNNIYMPAVYFAKTQRVYTPFESRIDDIKIKMNDKVTIGETLMVLSNPKLTRDKIINLLNLQTKEYYSSGALLSEETRKSIAAKKSEIDYQKTIQENLKLKSKQLELIAPFNGKITAIKNDIYNNTWLSSKAWLFDIVDFNTYYLQAFISARDLRELDLNERAKMIFIPNKKYLPVCRVRLKSIAQEPISKIPRKPTVTLELAESTVVSSNLLLFASKYGDQINLQADQENNWVPIDSFFTVDILPRDKCDYDNRQIIKGVVKIRGEKRSVANRVYESVRNTLLKLS